MTLEPGTRPGRRALLWSGVLLATHVVLGCGYQTRPVRVAAASDLQFALPDIARAFAAAGGGQVDLVFGSSGLLARQIRDGAPFELFLSADEAFVDELARDGFTRDAGRLYAVGRLALFAPHGSPLDPRQGLEGLKSLAAAGGVARLAIANPAHAPYGRAAEQALRRHDLWDTLQPALVLGDNVTQAAQFATTGNAVGGLIAASLAMSPDMRGKGTFSLVPADDHEALRQRMVLLTRATDVADRFYAFVASEAGRQVMARHGFTLP